MPEYEPFKYRCDGEGCDRTIGDVGAFLWKFKGDLCYCSNCWEKLQASKYKCPNCTESLNLVEDEKKEMMICNRCGCGEHKDKFRVK